MSVQSQDLLMVYFSEHICLSLDQCLALYNLNYTYTNTHTVVYLSKCLRSGSWFLKFRSQHVLFLIVRLLSMCVGTNMPLFAVVVRRKSVWVHSFHLPVSSGNWAQTIRLGSKHVISLALKLFSWHSDSVWEQFSLLPSIYLYSSAGDVCVWLSSVPHRCPRDSV